LKRGARMHMSENDEDDEEMIKEKRREEKRGYETGIFVENFSSDSTYYKC
jgi:hypothetical protein